VRARGGIVLTGPEVDQLRFDHAEEEAQDDFSDTNPQAYFSPDRLCWDQMRDRLRRHIAHLQEILAATADPLANASKFLHIWDKADADPEDLIESLAVAGEALVAARASGAAARIAGVSRPAPRRKVKR
jgi:hypothetical protein